MTICETIDSIANSLRDSYKAVETLGGTIPSHKNLKNLNSAVSTLMDSTVTQYITRTLVELTDSKYKIDALRIPLYYQPLLTKVSLPVCTAIPADAGTGTFQSCDSLVEVFLPACRIYLSNTFGYCRSLRKLTTGGFTSFDGSPFTSCHSLESIYVLNTVPVSQAALPFDDTPFSNSAYLGHYGSFFVPSVALESYKTTAGWSIYSDRIAILSEEYDQTYIYMNEFAESALNSIPTKRTGVSYVLDNGFKNCLSLSQVELNSCFYVGRDAFGGCSGLQTVSLPGCSVLKESAFCSCNSLTNVFLPMCTAIESFAFENCPSLSTITLNNCRTIGTQAFYSCLALSAINASLCSTLGNGAFIGCNSLQQVSFDNLKVVGSGAFSNCRSLTTVIGADSITTISDFGFCNCSLFSQTSFPLVEQIGSSAFCSCVMSEFIAPQAQFVGGYCFRDCGNLQKVSLPACKSLYAYTFAGCSMLTSCYLPSCEEAYKAFYQARSLENCVLTTCRILGNECFYGCSALPKIELPACARLSGSSVFQNCTSLSQLIFGTSRTAVGFLSYTNTFVGTPMSDSSYLGYYGSIYVPDSLVESYKSATNWVTYADRITGISNLPSEGE